jgi:hypothetical protein
LQTIKTSLRGTKFRFKTDFEMETQLQNIAIARGFAPAIYEIISAQDKTKMKVAIIMEAMDGSVDKLIKTLSEFPILFINS